MTSANSPMTNSKSPAPMSVEEAVKAISADIGDAWDANLGIPPFTVEVDYPALKTLLAAYEESQQLRDDIHLLAHRLRRNLPNTNSLRDIIRLCEEHGAKVSILRSQLSDSHLLDTGDEVDWKVEWELERDKFQAETGRASALTEIVRRFIVRHESEGCRSEGSHKPCTTCTIMADAEKILQTPTPVPDTEKVKTEPMEELDDLIMQYATEEWASDRTISQEEDDHCRTERERLLTAIHQHVAALVQAARGDAKQLEHNATIMSIAFVEGVKWFLGKNGSPISRGGVRVAKKEAARLYRSYLAIGISNE